MEYEFSTFRAPEESYSRQLDKRVASQEMPYGYSISPPPADTQDFDMYAKETKIQHQPKRKSK